MVVAGGVVSAGAWITSVLTASALPAMSHDRNFTVVELFALLTLNAPV
jgi:hypothetical protein